MTAEHVQSYPCAHGRRNWQICPWCLGLNQPPGGPWYSFAPFAPLDETDVTVQAEPPPTHRDMKPANRRARRRASALARRNRS